jgi:hypothetical protein
MRNGFGQGNFLLYFCWLIFNEEKEASSRFITAPSSRHFAHVVNWDQGICTCPTFQDCGYFCRHALAMARQLSQHSHDKICPTYKISSYRATYLQPIPPMHGTRWGSGDFSIAGAENGHRRHLGHSCVVLFVPPVRPPAVTVARRAAAFCSFGYISLGD